MQLYEKVTSPVGRITYREHVPPVPDVEEFDSAELVTLGVAMGTTMLLILERQLPSHARNARKLRAITDAVYDLAKGHGAPIDEQMVDFWVGCWNRTMQTIQDELSAKKKE